MPLLPDGIRRRYSTQYLLSFLLLFFSLSTAFGQGSFIPNKGQWDHPDLYEADIAGGRVFVHPDHLRYSFTEQPDHHHQKPYSGTIRGHAIFYKWLGADEETEIEAGSASEEYYNYFLGNRSATGLRSYKELRYKELYPGIDMLLEDKADIVKFTYFLKPHTDPSQIRILIEGAKKLALTEGRLYITTTINQIMEEAPVAYQIAGDRRIPVACVFRKKGDVITFSFPQGYNPELSLVIDPTVIFASYSGSRADNFGFTGTYDSVGNGYMGGTVYSTGYPVTAGAFQTSFKGGTYVNRSIGDDPRDIGIMKLRPDGKSLVFATYLGGSGNEQPHSLIVDKQGNLVVYGTTYSRDFPRSANAFDTAYKGSVDIFITKLSADGKSLVASTYVGGKSPDGLNGLILTGIRNNCHLGYNYGDQFRGEVITDDSNNVYIASSTYSTDFPVTTGAYQTSQGGQLDAVVFKMNASLSKMEWGTYLGGTSEDAAYSLKLDSKGDVIVCGGTHSSYFFKDTLAYQNKFLGDSADGFICHISNNGQKVADATYLGTAQYDQTYLLQLDASDNVYVFGQTRGKFPVVNANYSDPNSGQFITKLNPKLDKLIFSTVFGSKRGIPDISPTAFLVDDCERIYISGWGGEVNEYPLGNGGSTKNMRLTPDARQSTTDTSDFYLAVFSRDMDTILYGSYFGGTESGDHVDGGTSRFDKKGIIYQSVCASCGAMDGNGNSLNDFPTTPGAWSTTNNGIRPGSSWVVGCNNLLFKIDMRPEELKANFDLPSLVCDTTTLLIKNKSTRARSYLWTFKGKSGTTTSTAVNPTHTFTPNDTVTVSLVATNFATCSVHDTMTKQLVVYRRAAKDFSVQTGCDSLAKFKPTGVAAKISWKFGDGTTATGDSAQHIYKKPGLYTVKMIADSGSACADSATKKVLVNFVRPDFSWVIEPCKPVIHFFNQSVGHSSVLWHIGNDTSTANNPVYTYKKAGLLQVWLVIRDSNGCSDSILQAMSLSDKPKAAFTIKYDTCSDQVTFTNKSLGSASYFWNLGNATSTSKDVTNTYAKPGIYKITLIVQPGTACADTISKFITIKFVKAGFTYTLDTCKPILHLHSTAKFAETYLYDFGNGDTSHSANPVYTFSTPGKYRIKQTVKESGGCSDTFSTVIEIAGRPKPVFSFKLDTCSFVVHFSNESKGAFTQYWQFGDGKADTARNPVHQYPETADSSYTVKLIINKGTECADSVIGKIKVFARPKANFILEQDSCMPTARFFSTSTGATSFHWQFGDSTVSTDPSPVHTYPKAGTYQVTLTINPGSPCTDVMTQTVMVKSALDKDYFIPNVFSPNGDGQNEFWEVQNASSCFIYSVEIYNRWGQLLFKQGGNHIRWDGTDPKGKALPEGVYYFVFDSPKGEIRGSITVVR